MKVIYLIILLFLYLPCRAQTWPDSSSVVNYNGYSIKKSNLVDEATAVNMFNMLKKHIDRFSEYVDAQRITFFKSVPILLSAKSERQGMNGFGPGPGSYAAGKLRIYPTITNFQPNRPVLLHEYIHAYQAQVLGARNDTIIKYFKQAKASGLYASDEYMLKNPMEFFAMTATAVLSGSIARQPYNRGKLKKEMPAYTAWLEKLFAIKE